MNSAIYYDQSRRRRRWSLGGRGLQGYSAFLAGADALSSDPSLPVSAVIGADVAAYQAEDGSTAARSIFIGVTTGVLTFLINRWLGKAFK